MERAQLVVITLGVSDGVAWELEEVVRRVDPKRVLFRISPIGPSIQAVVDFTWRFIPNRLPEITLPRGYCDVFICFEENWKPQILTSKYSPYMYSRLETMRAGLWPILQRFGLKKRRRRLRPIFVLMVLFGWPIIGALLFSLLYPLYDWLQKMMR